MNRFDCLVVADPRFSGGSTTALATDVTAMSDLGMRVGMLFVRSGYLNDARDPLNPKALALAELPGVTRLSPGCKARAKLAFLHHPLVFARGIEERAHLSAERAVLVAHHLPLRPDGSLEYLPTEAIRRARSSLGLSPWIAPVSDLVRAQMAGFAPFVRQTSVNWPNVFDVADWNVKRQPFSSSGPITIGRHGRSDVLKFPDTGAGIDAALPAGPDVRVRVLGCPAAALAEKGAHPDRWEVLEFGAEPVAKFLNTLDVFVYHYHSNLQEAFGRTVVEAGLCGRPMLLDPRLKPTFGTMAQYCEPEDVHALVRRIASDTVGALRRAADVARRMAALYASASLGPRIETLMEDRGTISRGDAMLPPLHLARKIGGHYRRRLIGQTG